MNMIKNCISKMKKRLGIPLIVSKQWLRAHEASYAASSQNNKWAFYWVGDYINGYMVKTLREEDINA